MEVFSIFSSLESIFLYLGNQNIDKGGFTRGFRSIELGKSRRIKVIGFVVIMMVIVTAISLVYIFRPLIEITNEPIIASDMPSDQHVVIYSVDVNGNNITVGEIGVNWQISLVSNSTEYDQYELSIVEHVRGSAADIGQVGWIEGGHTNIDLRSGNLRIIDWSETHGEGAVQVVSSVQSDWNGSIEWKFEVLLGTASFHPREASNGLEFTILIEAIHGTDVNLTIHAFSYWSIYGYSFDRVLVHGSETIVIDAPSWI